MYTTIAPIAPTMKRRIGLVEETNEACRVFYHTIALKKIIAESKEIKRLKSIVEYASTRHAVVMCTLCDKYGVQHAMLGGTKKFYCNAKCHVHQSTSKSHYLGCSDSCTSEYGIVCALCTKMSCSISIDVCYVCNAENCCKNCTWEYKLETQRVCNNCVRKCIICKITVCKLDNMLKSTNLCMCKKCYNKHV